MEDLSDILDYVNQDGYRIMRDGCDIVILKEADLSYQQKLEILEKVNVKNFTHEEISKMSPMEMSRISCVRYYLAEEESFLRGMAKWEKEKRSGQQPEP